MPLKLGNFELPTPFDLPGMLVDAVVPDAPEIGAPPIDAVHRQTAAANRAVAAQAGMSGLANTGYLGQMIGQNEMQGIEQLLQNYFQRDVAQGQFQQQENQMTYDFTTGLMDMAMQAAMFAGM